MTTLELITYYVNLLIIQYRSKPRAQATIQAQTTPVVMPQTSVQTLTFATPPSSGAFVLSWNGDATASINWNDSAATIQGKLRAVDGLSTILVTGSIAGGLLTVTFAGVTPVAALLELDSSTLNGSGLAIEETDETLPFAVQNGFNLTAPVAVGDQLDVLGKYAGVTRTAQGFSSVITLDDADFLTLIQMAIATNSAGSSLSDIQAFISEFFSGVMRVYDYQNMRMTYLISEAVGSRDLIEMLITQGLLPKPMGVQLSVIYAPVITNFFGFCSYEVPTVTDVKPFNTYEDYQTDWPWLDYADGIII